MKHYFFFKFFTLHQINKALVDVVLINVFSFFVYIKNLFNSHFSLFRPSSTSLLMKYQRQMNIYIFDIYSQIIEKRKFFYLIKLMIWMFCRFLLVVFFCALMIKLFTFVNLTFCFCVFWDQLDINDEENFRTKGVRYTQYLIKRARTHACLFLN